MLSGRRVPFFTLFELFGILVLFAAPIFATVDSCFHPVDADPEFGDQYVAAEPERCQFWPGPHLELDPFLLGFKGIVTRADRDVLPEVEVKFLLYFLAEGFAPPRT